MSKGIQYLFKKNNITVIPGHGKLTADKKVAVTSAAGEQTIYEAKHIILATGARSRVLPAIPQDGKRIIGYREALTLDHRPASLLVVGSGAIGSELAWFYNAMGIKVTLVEFMPTILPVEDEEVSKQVGRSFKKAGIEYTIKQIDKYRALGVEGIHLYALNKWKDVSEIIKESGMRTLV